MERCFLSTVFDCTRLALNFSLFSFLWSRTKVHNWNVGFKVGFSELFDGSQFGRGPCCCRRFCLWRANDHVLSKQGIILEDVHFASLKSGFFLWGQLLGKFLVHLSPGEQFKVKMKNSILCQNLGSYRPHARLLWQDPLVIFFRALKACLFLANSGQIP